MIPVNDLQRTDADLLMELKRTVSNCITKGWYLLGPETQAFENEFAAYCGANYCIGVANGTDAIEIALRALDIRSGDEVATVANAGMYSTIAIKNIDATPLYIEVDLTSMNMNPLSLKNQLTKNTKAIIVTHLYGQLASIEEIIQIANEKNIPVIEDCAQAHGAKRNNQKAGSFGTIGCFSFYPTKNLGAMGDAGAIITNHSDIALRVNQLRQYGWDKKYHSLLPGGQNSRIDELQAAILRIKLKFLDEWNKERRQIAEVYTCHLKDFDLQLPKIIDQSYVAHLYVIRLKNRDQLRQHLLEHKISSEIHYPVPDYRQLSVKTNEPIHLESTEKCCNEVLTLPCFPGLNENEIVSVIKGVKSFFIT